MATWVPHICGVGYVMPTPAGVVQRRLLFVVVVQAKCVVVLLFLFEHFGTVQCPTLSSNRITELLCVGVYMSSHLCIHENDTSQDRTLPDMPRSGPFDA